MANGIDLADPDFEPTGEQLQELSKRAFAGVREAHEKSLVEIRARIAKHGDEVLQRLADEETARARKRTGT